MFETIGQKQQSGRSSVLHIRGDVEAISMDAGASLKDEDFQSIFRTSNLSLRKVEKLIMNINHLQLIGFLGQLSNARQQLQGTYLSKDEQKESLLSYQNIGRMLKVCAVQ